MLKRLNELTVGEKGIIKTVEGVGALKRRLFDMGVTPGAQVTVKKLAPLGDPIEINIRGYELSLRKDEGKLVTVEVM